MTNFEYMPCNSSDNTNVEKYVTEIQMGGHRCFLLDAAIHNHLTALCPGLPDEPVLKETSPTHTHEEEEEGFAQKTRSASSQRRLLEPNMPAYNPSQLDGWLKLTASAFNQLWISMPTVLVTVPTVMQNYCYAELTASFINFLHHCLPSSGFYGAGKDNRGRHTNNPSGRHPILTTGATTYIIPWLGTGTE